MGYLKTFLVFCIFLPFADESKPQDQVFPSDRLNAWTAYLERVPFKVGKMTRKTDKPPASNNIAIVASKHGYLSFQEIDGSSFENIHNEAYFARVKIRKDRPNALVVFSKPENLDFMLNTISNTSIFKLQRLPDLIRDGKFRIAKTQNENQTTQWELVPVEKDHCLKLVLEFDDRVAIPVYWEQHVEIEGKKIITRMRYLDFVEVNGELVPTKLESGKEYEGHRDKSVAYLSYSSTEEFGPDRFRLAYYGIAEPEAAKFEEDWSYRFWILSGLAVAAIFGVGIFTYIRLR